MIGMLKIKSPIKVTDWKVSDDPKKCLKPTLLK